MVKKVETKDIIDCGSSIYGLHNMCFFLCLYKALGEKDIKLFYEECKVVADKLPKAGEMIDTERDSSSICTLARYFNVYIRIFPTLNICMPQYISDIPVEFGYFGSKKINIIHVGNHYMILNIDPDRLLSLPENKTLQLVNEARVYQTTFMNLISKDEELAKQLQEQYLQEQKDAETARKIQEREDIGHKKYIQEQYLQEQKDAETARKIQEREDIGHKKYIQEQYIQEQKDAELARELSVR
jgi:hypothetical protein